MWQSPSQRARALARIKERERDRNRNRFHIKRVRAEVKLSEGLSTPSTPNIVQARLFLNDMSSKGIGIFTTEPFVVGQQVALNVADPFNFFVKGRIVWCMEHTQRGHIISEVNYNYRVGIEFTYASEEEKKAVEELVENLHAEHIQQKKAA